MTYASDDHCYVLVRVARHRETANLPTDMESTDLHEPVAKQVASVNIGDSSSVIEFVRSFGSHYVTSYVTGNSLYQASAYCFVFVRNNTRPTTNILLLLLWRVKPINSQNYITLQHKVPRSNISEIKMELTLVKI